MGIKNISDNREQIRVSKDRIFYNINMRDIDYIRAYNSETQIFAKGETFLKYQGLMLWIYNELKSWTRQDDV